MKKIKVIELFAGIGGFRVGMEGFPKKKNSKYEVVWSNQWEPSTKIQYASMVYEYNFGKANHSNEDINTIKPLDIPDHDLLCGGFPCQDFSVGGLNKYSKGLEGTKGVLWFSIKNILDARIKAKKPTKYIFLENVDRLLKCPVKLKGEDFRRILTHLDDMGYAVEWKVINAADYGMPQRRRRIFILGYHKSTKIYNEMFKNQEDWLYEKGVLAKKFKSKSYQKSIGFDFSLNELKKTIKKSKKSPFESSGIMINGNVLTRKILPKKSKPNQLINFLIKNNSKIEKEYGEEFYISKSDYEKKWKPVRAAKERERKGTDGFTYLWAEGKMSPWDYSNRPARTIITSEGGKSASRTKHIIKISGKIRRLLPIELERLDMFPDNFTKYGLDADGEKVKILNTKRAFLIGNALVVGVIEKISKELKKRL